MLDLLIVNALIVDGTGKEAFRGEVGIAGEKIVEVNRCPGDEHMGRNRSEHVIDAGGGVVCPGFIDLHCHSDRKVVDCPDAGSSLLMGVTTEIGGNCGKSAAPAGTGGENNLEEFFEQIADKGVGNNHGIFVGQGTVRELVMGRRKDFPSDPELDRMKELVRESMQMGAFGLSTGRAYEPGCYGGFREIVELTEVVGEYGGLYTSHIADQWACVDQATREVLEIGMRAGAIPHVAHQKVVGKENWGRADEVLAILEEGHDRGIELMADVYPYPFSAVIALKSVLPEELHGETEEEILDNIRTGQAEDTIRKAFRENPTYVTSRLRCYGIVQSLKTKDFEGLDMGEAAVRLGTDLAGAVRHLLIENRLKVKIAGIMDEDDVAKIIAHPLVMIGSDSSIRSPDLDEQEDMTWSTVHPREYGTFPRVLGRYVRDKHLLELEEAVYKMSGMPASRLGLTDRGKISRGFFADLVIFDPENIGDRATVDAPCNPPEGLDYVLVNGQVAVEDNELKAVRAGHILRDSQGRMLY